jgi:hypothetical protein
MGTLFMASPCCFWNTPTAIESRLVTGMVPSVANLRGAVKRRWLLSAVRNRMATSSLLALKEALTTLTIRSAMSRNSSSGSAASAFLRAMAASRSITSWSPASTLGTVRSLSHPGAA